jgi:hypothetical protein
MARRPRYRSSGAVVTSDSRFNVQFFTNGGVTPITIATILLGAGAYVAAVNHWPVVSPIMYWVALQAYQRVPALERYNFAQAPYVVSALIVAGVFFCVATSFAPLLAKAFTRAGIKNLEKQTAQLKQHRAKLKKKRRDDDEFIVG